WGCGGVKYGARTVAAGWRGGEFEGRPGPGGAGHRGWLDQLCPVPLSPAVFLHERLAHHPSVHVWCTLCLREDRRRYPRDECLETGGVCPAVDPDRHRRTAMAGQRLRLPPRPPLPPHPLPSCPPSRPTP